MTLLVSLFSLMALCLASKLMGDRVYSLHLRLFVSLNPCVLMLDDWIELTSTVS
ncbi:hypothetical protein [Vacuolonema iberomarrocanum]|uniref:hypothetical protein n=1 Tax=Vacuolonema iberomarrocanum TaxID=3454632 RepID=UPI0019E565F7|nr:hypothetical protein [filamentous cyanobacterium LEGE 07170]